MLTHLERLYGTGLHNIKPGLDRITAVLESVNAPHRNVDFVLVGGTNGKCSVATAIAEILGLENYKTGLYTSPHLVDVSERFRINSVNAEKEKINDILGFIFSKSDELGITLSYFELLTAAAFVYFKDENIDIGILEVGMGGRWDATNVCDALVSVITNVTLDHTAYLGNSIEQIASEKAEILKENGFGVTGARREALEIIRTNALKKDCSLFVLGENFYYKNKGLSIFDYHGIGWNLKDVSTGLKGFYQNNNLALSIACIEILNNYFDFMVSQESVLSALGSLNIEGRFEYLRETPPVIMDGAHNEAAAEELARTLDNIYPDTKFVFLVAMLKDKDHIGFFKRLLPKAEQIVITQLPDERCETAENLRNRLSRYSDKLDIIVDPSEAFEKLVSAGYHLCVTGSLYLLGYLKTRIRDEENRFGL